MKLVLLESIARCISRLSAIEIKYINDFLYSKGYMIVDRRANLPPDPPQDSNSFVIDVRLETTKLVLMLSDPFITKEDYKQLNDILKSYALYLESLKITETWIPLDSL